MLLDDGADTPTSLQQDGLLRQHSTFEQLKQAGIALPDGIESGQLRYPATRLSPEAERERFRTFKRATAVRRTGTLLAVLASSVIQVYALQAFAYPANLLSSGFTGVAILIDRITSMTGTHVPTYLGIVALNVPVALLCWHGISHRFVCFSMLQVLVTSLLLRCLSFEPILDNLMLQVLFGGFIYGLSVSVALRGGASTAGTDFIALLVSNKTGKSIWGFVFTGNCMALCVFGYLFGWEAAAYSIIFQFVSTKTIETFYHRYDRMTLQITTRHPQEVLAAYNKEHHHGSSVAETLGGHSQQRYWVITTVASSYEVSDIVHLVHEKDCAAIINVFRTERFYGSFYRPAMD